MWTIKAICYLSVQLETRELKSRDFIKFPALQSPVFSYTFAVSVTQNLLMCLRLQPLKTFCPKKVVKIFTTKFRLKRTILFRCICPSDLHAENVILP